MITYKKKQFAMKTGDNAGKWYAIPVVSETYDLERLADHMSHHNTPFSQGVIKGVLADMVACIKELLLDGKSVKLDDLAISPYACEPSWPTSPRTSSPPPTS